MSEHAKKYSPSGWHKWSTCPGSVVLEAPIPDPGSQYAIDGTAAHIVAAMCLTEGTDAAAYSGRLIRVSGPDQPEQNVAFGAPDLVGKVQAYVDDVRSRATNGRTLLVEQRVNFGEYTADPEDSFGTADVIILPADDGDGEMTVEDLKTGYTPVDVEDNGQLMLYALAAYAAHSLAFDIRAVRLVIFQDGPREWVISVDDLLAFGETKVRVRAEQVRRAVESHGKGTVTPNDWNLIYLNQDPTEDSCRFCRAQATCPSMQRKVQEVVGADFEEIVERDPAGEDPRAPLDRVNSDYLSSAMAAVGLIEDWCKAVRAEVERRLLAGQEVPGFGLELGRQGNRAWADPTEAEGTLKAMRLKVEEMYDLKLINPTTAEKLANEKVIGPRQWKSLQKKITRADPKPSVKPLSVIKTPYVPPNAADDFAPIPETQQVDACDLC